MKIPFFDIENWKEIGATLARNKTRTFLTAFGIFWGVFMLASLLGGARGAEDLLRRNFEGFATNAAIVAPSTTSIPYKGYSKGRQVEFNLKDVNSLRVQVPELSVVTPMVSTYGISLKNGKYSYTGGVQGLEGNYTKVMTPNIDHGRFINDADVSSMRKVAVIGSKVTNEIFPGDPDPVGKDVEINGIIYKVVGVASQKSEISMGSRIDDIAIIPLTTFQRAFNRGDKVEMIMMVGRRNANLTELENRIRHVFYSNHYISPLDENALWYMNIAEQFEKVDSMFTAISFLAGFIGFSTLIAGVIGIGNIMWVIVKERTQEIGIRRAIGARPLDITAQILSEGITLTAIAGMAGISLATVVLAIATLITSTPTSVPHFEMTLGQAGVIFGTFILLGTLAGIIPALKAMRIKPIEALNDK